LGGVKLTPHLPSGGEAKNDWSYIVGLSHICFLACNRDNFGFNFMAAKLTARNISVPEHRNVKTFYMQ
jgi:hypothetical protein